MIAIDAVVPLTSVALGAVITYRINVRQRHRNYIDDLFKDAIAAVAAAEFSVDYIASVGRPEHITDADLASLQSWMVLEGNKNWANKLREANDALAKVVPYAPHVADLLPFSPDSQHRGTHLPMIATLRKGPA